MIQGVYDFSLGRQGLVGLSLGTGRSESSYGRASRWPRVRCVGALAFAGPARSEGLPKYGKRRQDSVYQTSRFVPLIEIRGPPLLPKSELLAFTTAAIIEPGCRECEDLVSVLLKRWAQQPCLLQNNQARLMECSDCPSSPSQPDGLHVDFLDFTPSILGALEYLRTGIPNA